MKEGDCRGGWQSGCERAKSSRAFCVRSPSLHIWQYWRLFFLLVCARGFCAVGDKSDPFRLPVGFFFMLNRADYEFRWAKILRRWDEVWPRVWLDVFQIPRGDTLWLSRAVLLRFFLLSIINYRLGQRWVAPAGLFGFSRPANLMSLGSFVSKRAEQYWLVSDENLEIRECRSWTRSISNWMNTWTKEHWWGALRCARLTRTSIKANHYPGSWELLTKNSGPINNSIPWIPNLGDFTWQQVCAPTLLDIDSIACRQWF